MSSFSSPTHRLEGSGNEAGGLIVKKTRDKHDSSSSSDDHVFKKPTMSLFGLDRLARKKREEREAECNFREKKPRKSGSILPEISDNPDARLSFGKGSRCGGEGTNERKYRSTQVETPSHTGGVSAEALERIQSRYSGKEQKSHGVYASTAKTRYLDKMEDRRSRCVTYCVNVVVGVEIVD